ncbi:MAG: hydroxylamine oxidase [Planctomycetes bacterium]|nr:hydroxylamine oxidase [Planctomycetota bacterium]
MLRRTMIVPILGAAALLSSPARAADEEVAAPERISETSSGCIECHADVTPGIVADWKRSRHARTTPRQALAGPASGRRISVKEVPESGADVVVGCFECHGAKTGPRGDRFDHMGTEIHIVVSPKDCARCHPQEVAEFEGTKKAEAWGILQNNPVFRGLVDATISPKRVAEGLRLVHGKPSATTEHETCFGCHGTVVAAKGLRTIETEYGEMEVPVLENWPNQGVGRINPDGSKGSCAACHARHAFSIEVARKPYTCSQCHLEPDVPAYNVYRESKHGNIFSSQGEAWDFDAVPWKVGEDFNAPTCATCHSSGIASADGTPIAPRTHDFAARLWVRIFGLIYTHPQPKTGATWLLRSKDDLPLPVALDGTPAAEGLIDPAEAKRRQGLMEGVCRSCHGPTWVRGHFAKFDATNRETDDMIRQATKLVAEAWSRGLARGLPQNDSPFDEGIEIRWTDAWLFYANSIRYASAMTGAPDYAAFKNGWYELSKALREMEEWIRVHEAAGVEAK